jgi:hypothetical protein
VLAQNAVPVAHLPAEKIVTKRLMHAAHFITLRLSAAQTTCRDARIMAVVIDDIGYRSRTGAVKIKKGD